MRLPYVVEVQTRNELITDAGYDEGDEWGTIETRRADIKAQTGKEVAESDAVKGRTTYRITMRNGGTQLTSEHRLRHQGRIFEIESVVIDFKRPGTQVATAVEER